MIVKKNGEKKTIETIQEIIGPLSALSAKQDKPIIFETALQYSLCLVPLSLAHSDGTTRKMNAWMSALMKVIKSFKTSTEEDKSPPK